MLESCVLLLEDQDASGTGLGACEGEYADAFPAETAQAANQTLRVVATDLVHAELFGELAGQMYRRDEMESVASWEGAIGIEAEREIDSLRILAVPLDGTA